MIHTILGAGGFAGNALAHELINHKITVRLVSRSTHEIQGTESVKGDLLSARETAEAVRGSDVVYLCVGLPYDSRAHLSRCGVYVGKVTGKMTEETPCKPCSKKGEIRANIATMMDRQASPMYSSLISCYMGKERNGWLRLISRIHTLIHLIVRKECGCYPLNRMPSTRFGTCPHQIRLLMERLLSHFLFRSEIK